MPRGRRATQVCCLPRMGAGRARAIAALTRRRPRKAPSCARQAAVLPPPRTARSDCPQAEGRLPPRPRPSRLLRRVSAPSRPGARRARPVPGRGRAGSRCSAQRRLHPRVWSQARRRPAGGGGGGGGILCLPRPPPRPPSSCLFHRLRAPLPGPSSWPGGASPGPLGQLRAFSGSGYGIGDRSARAPGAPGRGPGAGTESAAAWGAGASPSASRPASRALGSSGGGYGAERAAGAAVRAPPPQSRPPLSCRPPPALPHPASARPPAPRAALPAQAPRAAPATSPRDTPVRRPVPVPTHPNPGGATPTTRVLEAQRAKAQATHWHHFLYTPLPRPRCVWGGGGERSRTAFRLNAPPPSEVRLQPPAELGDPRTHNRSLFVSFGTNSPAQTPRSRPSTPFISQMWK